MEKFGYICFRIFLNAKLTKLDVLKYETYG